ncbi:hypothetical protein T07_4909 [Trichinella nelsoni]|uniref:Uncharacterized protein n=1 Tax=Trichinella nelsoni TaxID=6336 RepID=A0A0V0RM24_9BILA|nr:hypothetical protein T07_4909 [Trichinella nelsoni]
MPGHALPHCVGEPVLYLLYPDFSFANGWCYESSVHCVRTQYSPPFHHTPLASRHQKIASCQKRSGTSAGTGSTESLSRQELSLVYPSPVGAQSRRLPITEIHVDAVQQVLQKQARKRTTIERIRLHRRAIVSLDFPRGAASVLTTQLH